MKNVRTHAVTAGGEPSVEGEERAVAAVFEATSKAWADGDASAFTRWYAEGATVILPGVHLRDRAEVRAAMGAAFAGPLKGSERIHAVRSVRFLGEDVAVAVTRSVTVPPGETEPAAERWELATWTLSRNGGRWLIEAYHSCPAPPEPAEAGQPDED
ncbi:MAG TPA: SgcJ/EcaC family oxidoreductase [Spirillospora sp.]|nr:SgcJ/EcaC family oxidoreductase [Spirillospora sp.]